MAGLSSFLVPILEANNFNNWWFGIQTILRRELCEDVLETELSITATVAEKENWHRKDTKAQAIIVQGLSDKHLDIVKDCKIAKQQVEALKAVFARSSSFTKLSTWRRLINLKSESGEKLEDHFQANNADEKQIETEIQLYAANLCDLKDKLYFVLDSGASNHFVKEDVEEHMTEINYLPQYVTIHLANGENLKTNKKGTLKFECQGQKVSVEALIAPNMQHNLLSASKMTEKGCKIIMDIHKMEIKGEHFLLSCEYTKGLYISTADKVLNEEKSGNKREYGTIASDLWHRRLGHPSKEVLTELGSPNLDKMCSTCVEGKGT
ncbi:hypothetical protein JTB14_019400 [Gonioctena quinquepunctata]|nr:hypothetical protein JTB14_019400 [Gonioctena quinquepunctata]